MSPLINIENISFNYPSNKKTLENISFRVESGDFLGVIGPNGGGKSTLLNILAGFLKPTSGQVKIDRSNLSYVPQFQTINDILPITVNEYLEFGKINATSNSLENNQVLEMVEMKKHQHSLFNQLSGGQKQRILLAKAIIKKPKILLLDEPTTGLDSDGQDQLLRLLKMIKNDLKSSIVLVDHNIRLTLKYCDKILCLNKTLHWHNKKELFSKKQLHELFKCEFEHMLIHEDNDHGGCCD